MQKIHKNSFWLFLIGWLGICLITLLFTFFIYIILHFVNESPLFIAEKPLDLSCVVNFIVKFIVVAIPGSLIISIIFAKLSNHFYRYGLKGNSIRLERGIFRKSYEIIPYAKIQDVVPSRNPIEWLLGLASLKIKTAVGENPKEIQGPWGEGHLIGLTYRDAEKVRDRLIKKALESKHVTRSSKLTNDHAVNQTDKKAILMLFLGKIGNNLIVTVVICFCMVFFYMMREFTEESPKTSLDLAPILTTTKDLLSFFLPICIILTFLWATLFYHRQRFQFKEKGVVMGSLLKADKTIFYHEIQKIIIYRPIFASIFGLSLLEIQPKGCQTPRVGSGDWKRRSIFGLSQEIAEQIQENLIEHIT